MGAFFLVLEGPEGSGKSTLTRALADRLRAHGLAPVVVREPGGTPVAEALRAELLSSDRHWTPEAELLYICAARADLVAKVIRPALAAGRVVLSDRYELSTWAYQMKGRGLPESEAHWVNQAATGGLRPDLTLILDLPPDAGRARQMAAGKTGDRLDRESPDFHLRVAEAYRSAVGPGIEHLDASASPEELLAAAWAALKSRGVVTSGAAR